MQFKETCQIRPQAVRGEGMLVLGMMRELLDEADLE